MALRESVKADTAPYRRHMVVLSHLEAVTEAKRRLGLQVQVWVSWAAPALAVAIPAPGRITLARGRDRLVLRRRR